MDGIGHIASVGGVYVSPTGGLQLCCCGCGCTNSDKPKFLATVDGMPASMCYWDGLPGNWSMALENFTWTADAELSNSEQTPCLWQGTVGSCDLVYYEHSDCTGFVLTTRVGIYASLCCTGGVWGMTIGPGVFGHPILCGTLPGTSNLDPGVFADDYAGILCNAGVSPKLDSGGTVTVVLP